jgi:uncharacterized protein (TIGR02246 family)
MMETGRARPLTRSKAIGSTPDAAAAPDRVEPERPRGEEDCMRRLALVVAALVMAGATQPHAQTGKNSEIQKVADAFVAAWAAGDAKGLAALHAENAIRSTPEGMVHAGRAAIEKAFTEAFAGPFKGTKLQVVSGEQRTINADVVVASGTYAITGGNVPAGAVTKGMFLNTLVREGGRWMLVSSAPVPVTGKPAK